MARRRAAQFMDWDNMWDELDILIAQDFKIHQFNEYHFRINDRLDIWPTKRRWYEIRSRQKGFYRSIVEVAHSVFGYKPLAIHNPGIENDTGMGI